MLFNAPQRVKHICNVWMSCHSATLQGQWICLQEQELSEITGWQVDVRVDEEPMTRLKEAGVGYFRQRMIKA